MNYKEARNKYFNFYIDFEFLFCELIQLFVYHKGIKNFDICKENASKFSSNCINSIQLDTHKEFFCYFVSHGSFKKTIIKSIDDERFNKFLTMNNILKNYDNKISTLERHLQIRNMLAHRSNTTKIPQDVIDFISGANKNRNNSNIDHSIQNVNKLLKESIVSLECKNCKYQSFKITEGLYGETFFNCMNKDICRATNQFSKLKNINKSKSSATHCLHATSRAFNFLYYYIKKMFKIIFFKFHIFLIIILNYLYRQMFYNLCKNK